MFFLSRKLAANFFLFKFILRLSWLLTRLRLWIWFWLFGSLCSTQTKFARAINTNTFRHALVKYTLWVLLSLNRWIVWGNYLKHVLVAHLLFNPRPQIRQLLLPSGILRLLCCNWLLVKLWCFSWGWTEDFSCEMRPLICFYNFIDLLLFASLVPDFLALLHGFKFLKVFHLTFEFLVKCRQIF